MAPSHGLQDHLIYRALVFIYMFYVGHFFHQTNSILKWNIMARMAIAVAIICETFDIFQSLQRRCQSLSCRRCQSYVRKSFSMANISYDCK